MPAEAKNGDGSSEEDKSILHSFSLIRLLSPQIDAGDLLVTN